MIFSFLLIMLDKKNLDFIQLRESKINSCANNATHLNRCLRSNAQYSDTIDICETVYWLNRKCLILYNVECQILSLETFVIVWKKFPAYIKLSVKQ